MSDHEDLLKHARALVAAHETSGNPADLRRAVSAAYYSLFHLFINEASQLAASEALTGPSKSQFRDLIRRRFEHKKLLEVFTLISQKKPGTPPKWYPSGLLPFESITSELKEVAIVFRTLLQNREAADYELREFTLVDAGKLVEEAAKAQADWANIRTSDSARALLAIFVLHHLGKAREEHAAQRLGGE